MKIKANLIEGSTLLFSKLSIGDALVDIQTTVDALAKFGDMGVVGYCFGGLLTWLSACSVSGLSAASCYYGGGISDNLDQENKCPTIMHFGLKDPYIPVEQIEKIKAKLSHLDIYTYDSDHGFNCNHRGSYDENSANLALSRTLTFSLINLVHKPKLRISELDKNDYLKLFLIATVLALAYGIWYSYSVFLVAF